jgi:putative ABC transport system permease protein
MLTLVQDLHFTLRQWRRFPLFYSLLVLILALGIGANTAIFSKLNQALFRPLPCRDADQIVRIDTVSPEEPYPGVSYLDLEDYRSQNRVFSQVALWQYANPVILRGLGEPIDVRVFTVSPELVPLFGFHPFLGRGIEREDCLKGADKVTVVSYQFWKHRLNGRRDIVGNSILLDDVPFTVVGVLPEDFWFPEMARESASSRDSINARIALLPFVPSPYMHKDRDARYLKAYGHLRPEVTLEQARTEMTGIGRRLESLYPETNRNARVRLDDLHDAMLGKQKTPMLLLFAAAGMVLLITCANAATLLLSRSAGREKEMAVRASLGAGNGRLARQLLSESLLLGLAAALGGLLMSRFGLGLFNYLIYQKVPPEGGFQLDWRVCGYTFLMSQLSALLFGLAPAWQLSRWHLSDSLKQTGTGVSASPGKRRFQRGLVGVEIVLSMILLIGSSLLIRSLWRLKQVDPGFRPDRVVSIMIKPSQLRLGNDEAKADFYNQIQQRLQTGTGIEQVCLSGSMPMSGFSASIRGIFPEGRTDIPESFRLTFETVGPGYFNTFGIPLVAGRDFSVTDRLESPKVTIVNRVLAQRFWPNENPIGKRLTEGRTVIGVAADTHQNSLEESPEPRFYFPVTQSSLRWWMYVVIRGGSPLANVAENVRHELQATDSSLFVGEPIFMESALSATLRDRQELLTLLGCFAFLATVLTVSGIYGVLANFVVQRTREIGIRMALGADRGQLIRMILSQALWIVLVGGAIGTSAALGLSRYLASQLYGVTRDDLFSYAGTAALFLCVACAAAYLPARKATRISLIEALRAE